MDGLEDDMMIILLLDSMLYIFMRGTMLWQQLVKSIADDGKQKSDEDEGRRWRAT